MGTLAKHIRTYFGTQGSYQECIQVFANCLSDYGHHRGFRPMVQQQYLKIGGYSISCPSLNIQLSFIVGHDVKRIICPGLRFGAACQCTSQLEFGATLCNWDTGAHRFQWVSVAQEPTGTEINQKVHLSPSSGCNPSIVKPLVHREPV